MVVPKGRGLWLPDPSNYGLLPSGLRHFVKSTLPRPDPYSRDLNGGVFMPPGAEADFGGGGMTIHSAYLFNAFLISLVLMRPLIGGAGRLGLTDLPGGRKSHETPTPAVGGIAVFLAFAATLAQLDGGSLWVWLPGLGVLVALGVVDDARGMNAAVKLTGQVTAVVLVTIPAGLVLADLGDPFGTGPLVLGPLAWPVTLLFLAAVINAFNLIDGIDGAAGGIAATAALWLAAAAGPERPELMMAALIVAFAVLGFLVYNIRHPWRERADAFLGDSGSMFLGAALALLIVALVQAPADAGTATAPAEAPPLTALLWIVALPCIDMTSLALRRILQGRSPFNADRGHLHHLLLDCGLSVRSAAFVMIAASAMLGGVGVAGWWLAVPEGVLAALLTVPVAAHGYFVAHGAQALRSLRGAGRRGEGTAAAARNRP